RRLVAEMLPREEDGPFRPKQLSIAGASCGAALAGSRVEVRPQSANAFRKWSETPCHGDRLVQQAGSPRMKRLDGLAADPDAFLVRQPRECIRILLMRPTRAVSADDHTLGRTVIV